MIISASVEQFGPHPQTYPDPITICASASISCPQDTPGWRLWGVIQRPRQRDMGGEWSGEPLQFRSEVSHKLRHARFGRHLPEKADEASKQLPCDLPLDPNVW